MRSAYDAANKRFTRATNRAGRPRRRHHKWRGCCGARLSETHFHFAKPARDRGHGDETTITAAYERSDVCVVRPEAWREKAMVSFVLAAKRWSKIWRRFIGGDSAKFEGYMKRKEF